jgi:saccharopine dehydrogenase-like NADP-dependent oxidoreductase
VEWWLAPVSNILSVVPTIKSLLVRTPTVFYILFPLNLVPGCRNLSTAENVAVSLPRTHAISLDVSSESDLDAQIRAHDLVVSLVPYVYHAKVIQLAIKRQKDVVTASYNNPSIQTQDKAARQAGITVLNEVGVDPGVDHLYAVKKFEEVHSRGGRVNTFFDLSCSCHGC